MNMILSQQYISRTTYTLKVSCQIVSV